MVVNRRMINNRRSRVFLLIYSMSEVHLRNSWDSLMPTQTKNSKHLKYEKQDYFYVIYSLQTRSKHAASVHCQVDEAVALDSEREAGCGSESRLHREMRLVIACCVISVEAILSLLCCKMFLWHSFSNQLLVPDVAGRTTWHTCLYKMKAS